MTANLLWTDLRLVTMVDDDLTPATQQAIVTQDARIAWVGPLDSLPAEYQEYQRQDGHGRLVTPGLIDSHSHVIFGGSRIAEWQQRLAGDSYAQIAQAGGGIQSTVTATREATQDQLLSSAQFRLETMMQYGVTAIDVKTGYGLDFEAEYKMLQVIATLKQQLPMHIRATCLSAHTVPEGMSADAYIESVCEWLPIWAEQGLVDVVDGFCEHIAFTREQIEKVLTVAKQLELPITLHAEQLSDQGGAQLAAAYGALSVDHLEYLSEQGAKAMAEAGTAAVLLPTAFYCLQEKQLPPVGWFRQYGVPMVIATDCNPGSSPCQDLTLSMHMACQLFGLTVEEAWLGVTRHAAQAFGNQQMGTLSVGQLANFVLWEADSAAEIIYWLGRVPKHDRVYQGVLQ